MGIPVGPPRSAQRRVGGAGPGHRVAGGSPAGCAAASPALSRGTVRGASAVGACRGTGGGAPGASGGPAGGGGGGVRGVAGAGAGSPGGAAGAGGGAGGWSPRREAPRRAGDWAGFGRAYEQLRRLL